MKKFLALLIVAAVLIVGGVYKSYSADAATRSVETRLGLYNVKIVTATVASGQSSATITVAGTDTDDLVVCTANSAGNQAVRQAVPTANTVTVTMEGNVDTNTVLTILVFQD